jgi:hypothetical protein
VIRWPVIAAVVARPRLWRTALRQARRLTPNRWWRRAPFLPLPSREYLEFRLVTQYGTKVNGGQVPDVLHYLSWCRQWDSV